MTDKLKPCPFCSCKTIAQFEHYAIGGGVKKMAQCCMCGAEAPIQTWNTRTDAAEIAELKAVLKQHHEWHQQPDLEMKLGDEFFDCASCYVDSTLEERTTSALKGGE